jgi:ABC-type transporter MlaC component
MAILAPRLSLPVPARRIALVTLLVIVAADVGVARAAGASATDELRRHFDEVLATAQSASFRALEPESRHQEIRKISGHLFNWSEMTRRALGAHWAARSASERRAFTDWFTRVAEHAYMGPLERLTVHRGAPEPIRYLGEARIGEETVVRTSLTYPRELPVDFLMSRRGGRWEVCDVRVDGVSAAENYHAQFQRVIARASYPELIGRMIAMAGDVPSRTLLAALGP